jgi:hypothetical protein
VSLAVQLSLLLAKAEFSQCSNCCGHQMKLGYEEMSSLKLNNASSMKVH